MDRLPVIPPTAIRKVRLEEFQPYFKLLEDVFAKYQLNRALGLAATEGTPLLGSHDGQSPSLLELENASEGLGVGSERKSRAGLTASQRTRLLSSNAPPLESVPSVFLQMDFNLGNPHIFNAITESLDVTTVGSASSAQNNNTLQEKLSHNLDIVEVHLIKEISRRSSSFFAALSNLQALHQETVTCVDQITELRRKLGYVSKSSVKKSLEVVRLKRRRGNLGVLYGGVKLVSEVRQTQPMIQILLGQGDYVGALDLIEQTALVLRGFDVYGADNAEGESSTLVEGVKLVRNASIIPTALDLRGVRSLANLNGQLSEMVRTIGLVMENEFVNIVLTDVRETVALMDANKISSRIVHTPAVTWIRNILENRYRVQGGGAGGGVTRPGLGDKIGDEEKLKARLVPLVLGLLRMDKLGNGFQTYKDALVKEIKAMTKKYYPPASASPETLTVPNSPGVAPQSPNVRRKEQQSNLAKQLRAMTFDSFFDLLISVYITLLHILQRVAIVHELIVQIVKEAQERGVAIGADTVKYPEPMTDGKGVSDHPHRFKRKQTEDEEDELGSFAFDENAARKSGLGGSEDTNTLAVVPEGGTDGTTVSSSTYGQMVSESSDLLFAASDLAHVRCAKLIGVRSEQNAQLNPKDFYRLFGATWEFVTAGESMCGRMCFGLKGTMLSQAKAFIFHFHEEKSKQMAVLVENEQWAQAQVPVDFQTLTDDIVCERLAKLHSDSSSPDATADESPSPSPATPHDAPTPTQREASEKFLVIGGQKYFVVGCVLLLLKMLTEYVGCVEFLPALTTDVMNRITEILKLFNSRTCQVILGAGAMRSAGLQNITAKHISLAAQSLGVVIAIIPHLKAMIQRHLPPKQHVLLGDFDRLVRDYKDHQNELYSKLVSIMAERLRVIADSLRIINWDTPEQKDFLPDSSVSVHMNTLVGETSRLHTVIMRYLPIDTVKFIMQQVFASYTQRLEESLKTIDLFSGAAKNRLLIDIQFFIQKLSALDGVDGPGNHLEVVVNNIKIKDRRAAQQQSSAAPQMASRASSSPGHAPSTGAPPAAATPTATRTSNTGQRPTSLDLPGGMGAGGQTAQQQSNSGSVGAGTAAGQRMGNFASAFGKMLRAQNAGLSSGSPQQGGDNKNG
ncbi:hypothetical protein HK097_008530 [Rhizophlyctis rosea]|uniref:Vacuolar protein sorting-associated protein 54 n=1 Tax=Rhizophlyctis rosea TaxID=64517 RepID=A0AAD5SI82_9FUNG|nr:hypothetical protein HK097_008530 [Rhizophlyctis rosea]